MENVTNDFVNTQKKESDIENKAVETILELGLSKDGINELSNGLGLDEGTYKGVSAISTMSRASYSNSPLVDYTYISPNRNSPRNSPIRFITIHMVWGQCTVEALGNIFAPVSRQASSTYGIGYDGRVGMYCPESDRPWTSSSAWNDHQAITIETASDTVYPYAVTDKAYAKLIELCADICKRNGKTKMVWLNSLDKVRTYNYKSTEMGMTLHKWFAATSCPGAFLEQRMQDIANKVNQKLGSKEGWIKENGKWYYYENNKKVTGWKKVDGKWYYMDAAGIMRTGWITVGKHKYYCGSDGAMLTGWQTIGGYKFYFKPGDSGRMVTGWLTVGGNKYYMDPETGAMTSGWKTIKGKKYYFKSGVMVTGWYEGKEQWRYFKPNGVYSKTISNKYKPYKAKVTATELNVRAKPSTSDTIVGMLRKNDKIVIVKTKTAKDKRKWGLVAYWFEKKNGWVALEYTAKI